MAMDGGVVGGAVGSGAPAAGAGAPAAPGGRGGGEEVEAGGPGVASAAATPPPPPPCVLHPGVAWSRAEQLQRRAEERAAAAARQLLDRAGRLWRLVLEAVGRDPRRVYFSGQPWPTVAPLFLLTPRQDRVLITASVVQLLRQAWEPELGPLSGQQVRELLAAGGRLVLPELRARAWYAVVERPDGQLARTAVHGLEVTEAAWLEVSVAFSVAAAVGLGRGRDPRPAPEAAAPGAPGGGQ